MREAKIMDGVKGWQAGDLHAPAPGVGPGGRYDPSAAEPVYHTSRYVHPSFLNVEDEDNTISSQWWRGSKFFLKVRLRGCWVMSSLWRALHCS